MSKPLFFIQKISKEDRPFFRCENGVQFLCITKSFNMPDFTTPRTPLLLTIEEWMNRETAWVVFEPNNQNTWTRVRTQVENYLTQRWREGALMGRKTSEAFFVRVGLGQTMTQLDILDGRLIVEMGVAVVRPAEFVLLRITHKIAIS